jgi:hypothetical protein
VPVESLVNFLDNDEHWRWRYLTLGFGSYDFSKLSILTNATTVDGWHYRGRDIPELANSGVGYLSGAKHEKNGINVLRSVLENASKYHLRFVFCNDRFYEPILNGTGFKLVDEQYEQVTLWANYDSPELGITEIVKTNHMPTLLDYLWGILPIIWLSGVPLLKTLEISKDRNARARA